MKDPINIITDKNYDYSNGSWGSYNKTTKSWDPTIPVATGKQIRQYIQSQFYSIDELLNKSSIGIVPRLQALEQQVSFEGEFLVENDPANIISGNGKIASANAVAGAIKANGIIVHLTQDEYDALPYSEKNNGNWYFVEED